MNSLYAGGGRVVLCAHVKAAYVPYQADGSCLLLQEDCAEGRREGVGGGGEMRRRGRRRRRGEEEEEE